MPTPTTSKWPKPKSEDEFEDMAVDFCRVRWSDPGAARNGRRGQRQDGIDIFGTTAGAGGAVRGAQCKNTETLTLAIVSDDIAKARLFKCGLLELLFITSGDRDARLQEEVRQHCAVTNPGFPVSVAFWEDVVSEICIDQQLVSKHWSGFGNPTLIAVNISAPGGSGGRAGKYGGAGGGGGGGFGGAGGSGGEAARPSKKVEGK